MTSTPEEILDERLRSDRIVTGSALVRALASAGLEIGPGWNSDMDAAPRDEWLWTYWKSDIHSDQGFYEVVRLDTEYFDEPTWVIQQGLRPVNALSHSIFAWKLPAPPVEPKENDIG